MTASSTGHHFRRLLASAFALAPFGSAFASPVQVIECLHTRLDGPTPYEYVDSNYTVRRHVVGVEPTELLSNDYWARGIFDDNGPIHLTITPFGGEPITLEASSTRTTVLDGKINFADTYLDEVPEGGLDYQVEGWALDSFGLILNKEDGSQIVDHTTVPEQIEREDWDEWTCNPEEEFCPVECALTWRVPGGSMPCSGPTGGGGICTTGRYIGRVLSIAYEDHEADHGAGFAINAGLNDAWVTAQAPFQGLFVTVYEALGLVFVAWFTFDLEQAPAQTTTQSALSAAAEFGGENQRWVTAVGSYSGNRAELNMELTSGGLFNADDPTPTQDTDYGTMVLEFDDCESGTVSFDIPSASLSGEFPISRVVDSNVALCETLASE